MRLDEWVPVPESRLVTGYTWVDGFLEGDGEYLAFSGRGAGPNDLTEGRFCGPKGRFLAVTAPSSLELEKPDEILRVDIRLDGEVSEARAVVLPYEVDDDGRLGLRTGLDVFLLLPDTEDL